METTIRQMSTVKGILEMILNSLESKTIEIKEISKYQQKPLIMLDNMTPLKSDNQLEVCNQLDILD